MKNELGIEVCCENCWFLLDCDNTVCKTCKIGWQHILFKPSTKAYKSRIKELQAKLEKYERDEGGLHLRSC